MIRAEKVDGGTQIMIEGTFVDVTAELCHVMERGIVLIRNKLNLDYDGSYESVMYALIKTVTEDLEKKRSISTRNASGVRSR